MSSRHRDIDSGYNPDQLGKEHPVLNSHVVAQLVVGQGMNNDYEVSRHGAEEGQFKRIGRRCHSKSRRGCHNCKKAQIKVCPKSPVLTSGGKLKILKCNENRPSCNYCLHRGLHCEWPDLHKVGPLIRRMAQPHPMPVSVQSQTSIFTMQDFRLFDNFIKTAYPHHPLRNDSVWTHEIPSIATDVSTLALHCHCVSL